MGQLSLLEASRLEDPGADDRALVERLSDAIVRGLDCNPPINLAMAASYQGISRVVACPLPNAGCLLTDPTGRLEIRLRESDHPRRRRFSGFHEISHTFMPGYQLQIQWRCDPPALDPTKPGLEALCDVGASGMLLPRRFFEPDLAAAAFGVQTVFDLSDAYDASLQATAHRLVELWPEDVMFIVAEVQKKPSERNSPSAEPTLRISYARKHGSWPFVRRFKSVAEGDPLMRALHGELINESCELGDFCTETVANVFVSARLCPYTDQQGVRHARVLALYRRPSGRT